MKKILFFLMLNCVALVSFSQTVLLNPTGDGGMETGGTLALNNWTAVNGASNTWVASTAAGAIFAGSRGACIGTATTYAATNSARTNHFYRDFVIPAGATSITLSFYYKMPTTDGGFDFFYVYTTTTANTPVAGTTPGAGYTNVYTNTNTAFASFTQQTFTLPNALAGTTVRLVFTYKNDGFFVAANPAVDNIQLTYCPNVTRSATASPTVLCSGATMSLTGSVTGASTYSWSGPGGYSSALQNPTAFTSNTATAGVYTVTGTVGGCVYTATTASVTVNALPGTITGAASICAAANATLSCTPSGGAWSSVTTSVATINSVTGQVFGASAGTSLISYTTICGSATRTQSVASAPAAIAGSFNICRNSGATTLFTQDWELPAGSSVPINTTPVNGWFQLTTPTTNYMTARTAASTTDPVISAAQSGTYFLGYSFSGTTAQTLCSPSFSMTGLGNGVLTFWAYRDVTAAYNTSTYNLEGVTILVNTASSLTGATTLGFVPRAASLAVTGTNISGTSTTGTGGWYQYTCTIPASYTGSTNYILFNFFAQGGDYSYLDNIALTATAYTTLTDAVAGGTWSSGTPATATIGSATGTIFPVAQGTSNIGYTSCGSTVNQIISINNDPGTITGTATVCVASSTTLFNGSTGGTWSSSNSSVASVNPTTGVYTGISQGTATINYSNGCGAAATKVVTVNSAPSAISSTTLLACLSSTITLTNTATGGTWSSTNTGIATVGSGSGDVHGVSLGTVNISYANGCGSGAGVVVTINPVPGTNTVSATSLCSGATATISNSGTSGSWSSSDPTIASINAVSGFVTTSSGGAVTLSYSTGCGTPASTGIAVNAAPAAINPISTVDMCVGLTTTLSNTSLGGTWSSLNLSIATVNSSTGIVSGVSAGVATIMYDNGCGAPATRDVNVNTPPNASITGGSVVCQAGTLNLFNTVAGGAWYTSNSSIATIDAGSGQLFGVSAGSATVSYITTGCNPATLSITTKAIPGAITGFFTLCPNTTTTLANSLSGGTWTSGTTSVATINSVTGFLGATSLGGTTTVTYSNGCAPDATQLITVSGVASPITGTFSLCAPSTITLFTQGWESPVGSAVPVGTTPVNGWAQLTNPTTNYMTTLTSAATTDPFISGAQSGTYFLGFSYGGTNQTLCSPSFSMTGLGNGVLTFWAYRDVTAAYNSSTYSLEGVTVMVNTSASTSGATSLGFVPRAGSLAVTGTNISGTSTTGTGGWFQYTCTIPAGYSGGTNYILFNFVAQGGDFSYLDNIVLTGISSSSTTTTLTDGTPGGSWGTSLPGVATINSSTGFMAAVTAGNSTINYTAACGSPVTQVVTINPSPAAIGGGTSPICVSATASLTNAVAGGTWSSANTAIASVNSTSGVVTGVAGGTAVISYSNGCGVAATKTVTITPLPATITGSTSLCVSSTGTLFNSISGGTWSTSAPTVVSVNSSTGVVKSFAILGSATITYSNGCAPAATQIVTVTSTPAAITGTFTLCQSVTSTLFSQGWESPAGSAVPTNTTPVNGWSQLSTPSFNYMTTMTSAATTDPFISGAQSGTYFLGYSYNGTTAQTLCSPSFSMSGLGSAVLTFWVYRDVTATYNTSTYSLEGITVMANTSASLTGATTLGFVPRAGSLAVTGSNISGTSTTGSGGWFQYTCTIPGAFSGGTNYILFKFFAQSGDYSYLDNIALVATSAGGTTSLTDATPGGTWSSISPGVASINTTGLVTGTSVGTSNISYTTACGAVGTVVTVNAAPGAIGGTLSICPGALTTLSNSSGGGTWVSGNTSIATVNASTGVVTGVAPGSVTITYSNGCGSSATATLTVKSLPAAITGATSICPSSSSTLFNTAAGGSWSTSSPSIISVNSSTGVINSFAISSSATITYSNGCAPDASIVVTVSSTTASITGALSLCAPFGGSFTTTLSDITAGGNWTSSNTAIATVGISSGIVTGVSAGTTTIQYAGPCGSPATVVFTVNPNPGTISGAGSFCVGNSISLSNSSGSGTWSSNNTAIASVNATTGAVNGIAGGTTTISFVNGCGNPATASVTVKSLPAPIGGATDMCPSSTTYLTNTTTGGTWTSSDPTVATIGAFTGLLSSTSTPGSTLITYSNGCAPDATSTVNVSSTTSPIVGANLLCSLPTPLVYTSFENGVPSVSGTPVLGWSYLQGTGAANSYWISATASSTANPAAGGTPSGGGTKVAQFSSKTIASGNTAALVSPAFDLSGGANGGKISFYFYRDATAGVANNYDSVAVYINTSPLVGGSWIGSVCRSTTKTTAYTGTAVAAGWYKYTYAIPSSYSGSTNYIVIKGYSAAGNNMYLDSILIKNNSQAATLTDATAGGTWSTDDGSVALVNSSGVVTAVAAGSTNINYTGACGSPQIQSVTVNPVPGSNTSGTTTLCIGGTTTVANALAGGIWYTSVPAIATVDVSGTVTGLSAGTALISYFNGCGAPATTTVTVNAVPTVASITASSSNLCTGTSLTITGGAVTGSGTLTSYNWSGPNSYMATSTGNSATFIPTTTAASGGYSVSVTYPGNGCTSANAVTSSSVTVNDRPTISSITASVACVGSTMTLTATGVTGTGVLTSYNWSGPTAYTATTGPTAVRTPTATTAGGVYSLTVTYPGTGCTSAVALTSSVTVNPALVAGSITGSTTLLTGGIITLTSVGASGGTGAWSSSNTSVATVNSTTTTGPIYGVSDGTVIISYTTTNPCSSSITATINITTQSPPVINSISSNIATPGTSITISGDKFNATAANNIVMFGATQGTVTGGSSTVLNVTVPTGATMAPINVLNSANGLSGYSSNPFIPNYDTTLFIIPTDANSVNFLPKVDFTVGVGPNIAAIGDLNADGKPDVVSVNAAAATISIYKNVGSTGIISGSTLTLFATYGTGANPQNVKIADLDGDGKPEIIVTSKGTSQMNIYRNMTSGTTLTISGTRLNYSTISSAALGAGPIVVNVTDIDGDGKPDLTLFCYDGNTSVIPGSVGTSYISVLRNTTTSIGGLASSGSFATAVTTFAGYTGVSGSITTADLDGDRKQDIIVSNQAAGTISIFPNNSYSGSISLGSAISLSTGSGTPAPTEVQAGDIDGDGFPDLAVTNSFAGVNTVSIFRNTNTTPTAGTFSFATRVDIATGAGTSPVGLALADVTGDGLNDLVVGNYNANSVSVFRNTSTTGSVTMASAVTYSTSTTLVGVVVGDVDGDTYPDIIGANAGSSSISVIKNYPLPHVEPITGSLNVCSDGSGSVTLSDATPTGVWSMQNANATINSTTGAVTGVARGTDIATYTKTVRGQINYATATMSIKQGVRGTINATPASICSGGSVSLTTNTPVYLDPIAPTYAWDGPGIATTTGLSINGTSIVNPVNVTTVTATGAYSVTIHPLDGVCADYITSTSAVAVNPQPSVTVSAALNGIVCIGLTETLTAVTNGGSGTATYAWSGPGLSLTTGSSSGYSFPIAISAPGSYSVTVSYSDATCIPASNITATVTPTQQQWVGGASGTETDWNIAANWTCGSTPVITDDVMIPSGTTYSPVIGTLATGITRNLTIADGVSVSLSSGAVLNVKGVVVHNGIVSGPGTFALSGTTAQTVSGTGIVNNMELNNTAGATIPAASKLTITNSLTLTAGSLATSDSLVLASSDTTSSGRIAPIASGSAITGKVQVQQYIQGGYRRFRFMGHPFDNAISLTQIQDNIDITGFGGSAYGFVTTGSNAPSAFRYDPLAANSSLSGDPGWKAFTDIRTSVTADSNKFNRYQGIRLFVRGAKGEGIGGLYGTTYVPSPTTIKMAGVVNQGDQTVTLSKGGATVLGASVQDYNMIGNPYPSPVDFGTVAYNALVSGDMIGAAFYVWNPSIGASGMFQAIPISLGGAAPYYVQANMAVQVRADHDNAHLTFHESNKSANASTYLFKTLPESVTLYMYDVNYHPWDMLYVKFNEAASENEDKYLDATKPLGSDFNFYSMSADNRKMVIDARPYAADKAVPLGINSAYNQDFIIKAESVALPKGGAIYLHDKMLQKYVELKAGTEYRFSITKDKSTQGDSRFELSMKPGPVTPEVKGLQVTMTPNPATDDVKIRFASAKAENVSVRVVDMSGISVYNEDLGVQQKGTVSVPLSKLAAGIYMVELSSGSQKVTQRLVKE